MCDHCVVTTQDAATQTTSQRMVQSYHIAVCGNKFCVGLFLGGMTNYELM